MKRHWPIALGALLVLTPALAEQVEFEVNLTRSVTLERADFSIQVGVMDVTPTSMKRDCQEDQDSPARGSWLLWVDEDGLSDERSGARVRLARELIVSLRAWGRPVVLAVSGEELTLVEDTTHQLSTLDELLVRLRAREHGPSPDVEGERALGRLIVAQRYLQRFSRPRLVLDMSDVEGRVRPQRAIDRVAAAAAITGSSVFSFEPTDPTLARTTGGIQIPWIASASRLVGRLQDEVACRYRLTIDATRFGKDRAQPLRVTVDNARGEVRAPSHIQFPGPDAVMLDQLLAPVERASALPLEVHLIPTGYDGREFSALVQLVAPGLPGDWELGAVQTTGSSSGDFTGRGKVRAAGKPVVLEREARFLPGRFEVLAVAHNSSAMTTVLGRVEGDWPDPDRRAAVVGPVAVLQEAEGVFYRGGEISSSGALAQPRYAPLQVDVPAALVGIVCSRRSGDELQLERRLVGRHQHAFPPAKLDLDRGRCGILQDFIPAGTLDPGFFLYEVKIKSGSQQLAQGNRVFATVP